MPARGAGSTQAAFRVEQEHASRHNLLALPEPFTNLDAVRQLHAGFHHSWFKAIACGHEDVLLHAGVDHGITRNRDDVLSGRLECGRAIESRPECASSIRSREPHAKRARAFSERGIDEIDPRSERSPARG